MNLFKEQIEYLKDNPEGYWFKRKLYGWGWSPAKWQGWVALLVFIILILLNSIRLHLNSNSESGAVINFILQTFFLTFLLVLLCYKKGEKPKWMWGLPKKQ